MPLINPGRGGFEELRVHFLTEKEQQQKDKLLKDYLMLIEIPVIGLGYDPTQIINAARYLRLPFYCIIICYIIYVTKLLKKGLRRWWQRKYHLHQPCNVC